MTWHAPPPHVVVQSAGPSHVTSAPSAAHDGFAHSVLQSVSGSHDSSQPRTSHVAGGSSSQTIRQTGGEHAPSTHTGGSHDASHVGSGARQWTARPSSSGALQWVTHAAGLHSVVHGAHGCASQTGQTIAHSGGSHATAHAAAGW